MTLSAFKNLNDSLKEDGVTMPVLFIGHGSPMNGIEHNIFSNKWEELAKSIPVPKAVLCVSAHWLTKGTAVTAMAQPKTIHDFGGFPQGLYQIQYPARGAPWLASPRESPRASRSRHLTPAAPGPVQRTGWSDGGRARAGQTETDQAQDRSLMPLRVNRASAAHRHSRPRRGAPSFRRRRTPSNADRSSVPNTKSRPTETAPCRRCLCG